MRLLGHTHTNWLVMMHSVKKILLSALTLLLATFIKFNLICCRDDIVYIHMSQLKLMFFEFIYFEGNLFHFQAFNKKHLRYYL